MTRMSRILGFTSPCADGAGIVRLTLGQALPLVLDVESTEGCVAEVWTNADNAAAPAEYRAIEMRRVSNARFTLDLPVERVGNYRATARVRSGDHTIWCSDAGIADLRFRPRDPAYDALCIEEVSVAHVNWDPVHKRAGTFRELAGGGACNVDALAERGVNAIWLLPVQPVSLWPERHPLDEAGSPYAVRDWFAVREELGSVDDMRAFLEAAHARGMRVILDVALNHVGHEHVLRDVDDDGRVVTRGIIEDVAPWMLASRHGHGVGAAGRDDKLMGGTFEWPDTVKLNHGRSRAWRYVFTDDEPRPEHARVRGWLERVLKFWVDVGVDGFRFDHLCGLPPSMLELEFNRVQAHAFARHGKNLVYIGEDFHTHSTTLPFLDAGQGGWFRDFLVARTPADFERILSDPWFHDLLSVSTHDEDRPIVKLGDDMRAWQRLASLLLLLGGPVSFVAGDVVGERAPLPFKRWRGIAALRHPSVQQQELDRELAKIARLRRTLPSSRAFLGPRHHALLAFARGELVVVANLSNTETQEHAFDGVGRVRLAPYEVRIVER